MGTLTNNIYRNLKIKPKIRANNLAKVTHTVDLSRLNENVVCVCVCANDLQERERKKAKLSDEMTIFFHKKRMSQVRMR